LRFENETDGHGGDADLAAHPLGKRNLETEAARHLRGRRRARNAAGRTVDHVDAARLQFARQHHGVVHVPAFLGAVDGGDAHEQRHRVRHFAANGLDDFKRQAHAAGAVAAIFVVARI